MFVWIALWHYFDFRNQLRLISKNRNDARAYKLCWKKNDGMLV